MSRDFSRISIERLCSWVLSELAQDQIFGIHKDLFFTPKADHPFVFPRYGKRLETPIGVAAGPHTQMAQNLISAWLCGARYLELKTVQTLDELNVSKPCIDMEDEGYNCEWSQELRLEDSFDEYLNAWILIHLLRHKFGWFTDTELGCIFNLSVGYNLEGIKKPNVQRFLDRMENCGKELADKVSVVRKLYPRIDEIRIPERISDNITLSTMHGCPPDEIEKIGLYLIRERKYHTTIKLNPTLLGPDHLRHILNGQLGFVSHIPDEAFGHDLKYPDALVLIRNLREASRQGNLHFSLKLTNTLESVNHKTVFPPNEKMMYLSGRALHPVSINVAAKLQSEFQGELDLTFSAGADTFNLPQIIACGIKPVTVCSDILKPGGYARLGQYLENLGQAMTREGAKDYDSFIVKFAGCSCNKPKKAAMINLRRYAGTAPTLDAYRRDGRLGDQVKTPRPLPAFDCVAAPCVQTCPAHQDIPGYLFHTANGDFRAAYEVILRTNPFPNVLGMVCDHQCQHRCTRSNYDQPLLIREIKRFIAEKHQNRPTPTPKKANGLKIGIVGAGPSGLACAHFLALEGFAVTVYETKTFAGGMVSDAIPSFRLTEAAIRQDVEAIRQLGVKMIYDTPIDQNRFAALRSEHDYLYVAIGAQKAKRMDVPNEDAKGVIDCLRLLSDVRRGKPVSLGKRVAVVGGGNSAMDAARTALRVIGKDGKVIVVYRRTRQEMPADREEVKALLEEGIEILELTAPVSVETRDGKVRALKCQKMRLGDKGADGRRKPEKIPGAVEEIPFDAIIPAIGQDIVADFISPADLKVDAVTGMTRLDKVFAGGDAVRGPATIIKAIADGREAARNILWHAQQRRLTIPGSPGKGVSVEEFQVRSARRQTGLALPEIEVEKREGFTTVIRPLTEAEAVAEAKRCLYCDDVCNVCVTVCPNRANRTYAVTPRDLPLSKLTKSGKEYKMTPNGTFRLTQAVQTLNIGDFCNECGNCTTFCPTSGSPYKDKPKFYLTEASLNHEESGYHLSKTELKLRHDGRIDSMREEGGQFLFRGGPLTVRFQKDSLAVETFAVEGEAPNEIDLEPALRMAVLFQALRNSPFSA